MRYVGTEITLAEAEFCFPAKRIKNAHLCNRLFTTPILLDSVENADMKQPQSSKCPLCGSDVHAKDVDIELPFRCSVCDKWLRVVHSRLRASVGIVVALLISGLVCFEFGARGSYLLFASILAWLPILFLVVLWQMRFSPPKLESCAPPSTDVLDLNR